jgi:hypothetical protein
LRHLVHLFDVLDVLVGVQEAVSHPRALVVLGHEVEALLLDVVQVRPTPPQVLRLIDTQLIELLGVHRLHCLAVALVPPILRLTVVDVHVHIDIIWREVQRREVVQVHIMPLRLKWMAISLGVKHLQSVVEGL